MPTDITAALKLMRAREQDALDTRGLALACAAICLANVLGLFVSPVFASAVELVSQF